MRMNSWSRVLVVLGFFSLAAQASPADPEPGTRVTVRLAESSGALPDPEKVVESLVSVGGKHQIRVQRRQTPGQGELTLDLWGGTVPREDMAQTLRETFPVLAAADIQVLPLDPKDRPSLEGEGAPDGAGRVRKVVKKIIRKE